MCVYPYVRLSVGMTVCMPVGASVRLSVRNCSYVCLSVCLPAGLPVRPVVCLSVHACMWMPSLSHTHTHTHTQTGSLHSQNSKDPWDCAFVAYVGELSEAFRTRRLYILRAVTLLMVVATNIQSMRDLLMALTQATVPNVAMLSLQLLDEVHQGSRTVSTSYMLLRQTWSG